MDVVSLLFSGAGRLAPKPFAIAIVLVYLVNFFSQVLMSAPVTNQAGLWPFAIVQVVLIWSWIVLHVKRLRDAGRSYGLAIGIACLYVLALALLLLVLVMIAATDASNQTIQTGQGLIRIFLVLYLFGMLLGSSEFAGLVYWLMGFLALLLLPVLIAFGFSFWAGTRPSVPSSQ